MRVNTVANRGTTQLEGVAELKAALAELSTDVATKTGKTANRRAAQGMAKVMRDNAPVSRDAERSPGSRKFGHLRDNIRVRLAKSRQQTAIVYNITVGRAFWGFFQEFGTRNMPAQPWMRTAFDASVSLAQAAQISELRTGIERAAKRAAKIKGR